MMTEWGINLNAEFINNSLIDIDFFGYNNVVSTDVAKQFAIKILVAVLEAEKVEEAKKGCEGCKHTKLLCSSCLRELREQDEMPLKASTMMLLDSGDLIKRVYDECPLIKTQLAHLLRETFRIAAINERLTVEELNEILSPERAKGE